MDFYRTTAIVAALLVATGVLAYLVTGASSPTALIPAFFGLFLGGLWALARRPSTLGRMATYAIVVVALLGALGSLGRVVPALFGGGIALPVAFAAQLITTVLCLWLVVAAVQHFRGVRRTV